MTIGSFLLNASRNPHGYVSSLKFTVILPQRKRKKKTSRRYVVDMTQCFTIECTSLLNSPDAALFTLNCEAEVRSAAAGKCGMSTQ